VGEVGEHRLDHARVDRRGGVVVHVDGGLDGHFVSSLFAVAFCLCRAFRRLQAREMPSTSKGALPSWPWMPQVPHSCCPCTGSHDRQLSMYSSVSCRSVTSWVSRPIVSRVSRSLSEKISRSRPIAWGAVSLCSQSRRNALISVSEKPRSCSFPIQSIRVTARPW